MTQKYQVTETMGIQEYTPEMQLRHLLQVKERTCDRLKEEIEELKQAIHLYHDKLEEYRKIKSELFPLIERLWSIDSSAPYNDNIRKEKEEIITTIAYSVAREWID